MKLKYLAPFIIAVTFDVSADSSTVDAAIGGAIGGGAGAAIGNVIGGRDGAIVGGAVGGAAGVVINTDDDSRRPSVRIDPAPEYSGPRGGHPHSYHCPPGQRKKGRC